MNNAITGLVVLVFALVLPGFAQAQTGTVTGVVAERGSGVALPGANVVIEGTQIGAATNADGEFQLEEVPVGEQTVRVNFIGYRSAERQVQVIEGDDIFVEIQLGEDLVGLDELVVTGAGAATERRRLGSTITSVSTADLETVPTENIQDMMRGRVPGMTLSPGSGQPGEGSSIRIRGSASLSMNNEPVVYIDGVRMDNRASGAGNFNHAVQSSPINDINPEDIERIEVLKGAAAATLYGSEANNGVIQIFTKRGSAGAPDFQFTTSQSGLRSPSYPSNYQYDAESGSILSVNSINNELRTGHRQSYSLSARGGSDQFTYYVSGNLNDESGITPTAENTNYGIRSNISLFPTEQLQANINLAVRSRASNFVQSGTGSTHGFSGNLMLAMPLVVSDARPLGEPFSPMVDNYARENSLAQNRVIGSFGLTYHVQENLVAQATLGYDWQSDEGIQFHPFGSVLEPTGNRNVRLSEKEILTVDASVNWDTPIGRNFESTTVAGVQGVFDYMNEKITQVTDFAGAGVTSLSGGATVLNVAEIGEEVVNAGFFVQNQLSIYDQLFVTTGVRFDGNTAFGEDLGLQHYPKLSVSYMPPNIGDNLNWLSSFRLRAAYGESGLQPGTFDAQRTYLAQAVLDGVSGIQPQNIGNPELKPERSREVELGFESQLFDEHVGLEVTYFNARTTDALLPRVYPPSQGFSNPQLENLAEIRTQGFETGLNTAFRLADETVWRNRLSVSGTYQKVHDLGGIDPYKPTTRGRPQPYIIEGRQPGAHMGSRLDPDDPFSLSVPIEELDDISQISGNALLNADGEEAFVFLGNMMPTINGSFSSNLAIGQFDLSANVTAAGDFAVHSGTQQLRNQLGITEEAAQIQQELKDPSTSTDRKRELAARVAKMDIGITSNWVSPADYIRLQDLSVRYRLPSEMTQQIGLTGASIMLAGKNLFTLTQFEGLADPDSGGAVQENFLQGYEYLHMARPREFQVTLRAQF